MIKTLLMGGPADGDIVMLEKGNREWRVCVEVAPLIEDSRGAVPTLGGFTEVRYVLAPYCFSESLQIFVDHSIRQTDLIEMLFAGYAKGAKR